MGTYEKLAALLGADEKIITALDVEMTRRRNVSGVMDALLGANGEQIGQTLFLLKLLEPSPWRIKEELRNAVLIHEKNLLEYLKGVHGETEFEKAANLSREMARIPKGFFLKKERGGEILKECPPKHLMEFLGCRTVKEMLETHDVVELFSALRFMESEEWMHETFAASYGSFTKDDFEERDVEVKVLGDLWKPVAEQYVAKKHHNVSHLKEFGVIFLNPIREDGPGKFIRDFALLLHYSHEIDFYSSMFRAYSTEGNFASRFEALLRGDVPESADAVPGEWLIIQRYLFKLDPADARLKVPHVNPESVHWYKAERDLADYSLAHSELGFEFWRGLDWVGMTTSADAPPVSFDLEDAAMSAVAHGEGRNEDFFYHQREALWTKLFIDYAGGEEEAEKLLIANFNKGRVQF